MTVAKPFVIDASALIALLRDEPGADRVQELLDSVDAPIPTAALMSTVNLVEVHQHVGAALPADLVSDGHDVVVATTPFTSEHARAAAAMRPLTRQLGLSLADRACLALAKTLGTPAITADRQWLDADVGVDVIAIR